MPVEQVTALAQASRPVASLDAPLGEDGELALGDLIRDSDPGAEEQVESQEQQAALERALAVLIPRDRAVVGLRFGLIGPGRDQTLEEVGQAFGLTSERIRQIEVKALRRLRQPDVAAVLWENLSS